MRRPDSDRVVYPGAWPRRTPDRILLDIAATLFYMALAAIPGYLFVAAFIAGWGIAGVFLGGLFATVEGIIVWANLHDAVWLEYSGGLLSWRGRVPWAPRMRPGRIGFIRWPVKSTSHRWHLEIVLTDGRKIAVQPKRGLMDIIDAVQQRDPSVRVDIQPGAWWMLPRPDTGPHRLARKITGLGALRATRTVVTALYTMGFALCILGVIAILVLDVAGVRMNFDSLRSYLAKVRLPPGYHLAAQSQRGSDCRNTCSITQTWIWVSPDPRTTPAICADAEHAMSRAFPDPVPNTPLPPGEACDYFDQPGSFFPPGQGKPTMDAVVTHTKSGQIAITLIAAYPPNTGR